MKAKWIGLILLVCFTAMNSHVFTATAAPYAGYNYSYWEETVPSPIPYLPIDVFDGKKLAVGHLKSPGDLVVSGRSHIYVLDSGNNRILHFDNKWQLLQEIKQFQNKDISDQFKNPQGIFITDNDEIYVADTDNQRIVHLASDGTLIREIAGPDSDILRTDFKYFPIKITVDKAKRIYVIGKGVFDGIMEFDADGVFSRFMGTNKVRFNAIDYLWKRISTKAQRDQMQLFIPIEFNNMDLDNNGFIYTTTSEQGSQTPIQRLNPSGVDVLKRNGYFNPKGDLQITPLGSTMSTITGNSSFIDIDVNDSGMYSALDSKRGRIFTYNDDGDLLYIFGQVGSQGGTFKTPIALERLGNQIIVLDQGANRITIFEPTTFGSLVNEAVRLYYEGEEELAADGWRQVLKRSSNYEIAYVGIGKSLLRKDQPEAAMDAFKLGNNRKYYSKAYALHRKETLREHSGTIFTSLVGFAFVSGIARHRYKQRTKKATTHAVLDKLKFPFYVIFHPFKAFWDIKYENRGSLKVAFLFLFLLSLTFIIQKQYSGFVVNYNNPNELNSLDELKFVIFPFFLWCIGSWSLTTLMDGEGKFKEIIMVTGYSLLPIIIVYIPLTVLSMFITLEESTFYYFFLALANIWFLWLLFIGTMTVQQYSVTKTIVIFLLTLLVMGIIIYLGLLFFSLIQQILSFVLTIYQEIVFRM